MAKISYKILKVHVYLICMWTPYWNLLALIKMAYIQQLNNF